MSIKFLLKIFEREVEDLILWDNKNYIALKNEHKSLLILFFVFYLTTNWAQKTKLPKPLKTYEFEGIKVKSFDFDRLEPYLNQKNDTLYVINFWATWCVPCIEELPHFEKLNQKYKKGKFKMILVSLDFPKMVESRLIPFIQKKKLQAEVVLLNDPDANRWIEKIAKEWTGAIPATIFYKKDKRAFYEKSFTEEELESEIKLYTN
jgi:thiol-disulfide isomerase/thioredoxin